MERIEIQCDAKNIWKVAKEIVYQTIQVYEPDLICDMEHFNCVSEWNRNRIKPIKFISKVGFYKKNLKTLTVFLTKSKFWWKNIPTETDKATLVIYLPKMFYLIRELRKEIYRIKSDEERNL